MLHQPKLFSECSSNTRPESQAMVVKSAYFILFFHEKMKLEHHQDGGLQKFPLISM